MMVRFIETGGLCAYNKSWLVNEPSHYKRSLTLAAAIIHQPALATKSFIIYNCTFSRHILTVKKSIIHLMSHIVKSYLFLLIVRSYSRNFYQYFWKSSGCFLRNKECTWLWPIVLHCEKNWKPNVIGSPFSRGQYWPISWWIKWGKWHSSSAVFLTHLLRLWFSAFAKFILWKSVGEFYQRRCLELWMMA